VSESWLVVGYTVSQVGGGRIQIILPREVTVTVLPGEVTVIVLPRQATAVDDVIC